MLPAQGMPVQKAMIRPLGAPVTAVSITMDAPASSLGAEHPQQQQAQPAFQVSTGTALPAAQSSLAAVVKMPVLGPSQHEQLQQPTEQLPHQRTDFHSAVQPQT